MLSVSQIAKKFGLSRTTILYYESCGLLKPALRTRADYRCTGKKKRECWSKSACTGRLV
jgi:hypothetical protein